MVGVFIFSVIIVVVISEGLDYVSNNIDIEGAIVDLGLLFYKLLLIIILYLTIYYIVTTIIKYKSDKYKQIIKLNKEQDFYIIPKYYYITEVFNTKRRLDNANINANVYTELINGENNNLQLITERTKYNKKLYTEYISKCEAIIYPTEENSSVKSKIKKSLENFVCKRTILKPRLNFIIKYTSSYTTPKKRKHYERKETIYFDEFEDIITYYKRKENAEKLRKAFVKNERSKMSDSLRYYILDRDEFRCVQCGKGVEDGYKLHVDHIIPVSKGGKTTKSNLQTLCERCNMGKSNVY